MNIGNKIKELRKKKGVTQEQLAANIGVSFQAVSKWENGITLPDITIAPLLANYFEVSMDELFDFSLEKITIEVDKIIHRAYKFRESNPKESKRIIEEGLKKYPDNEILLNNLLYVLDYSKNPNETIAVASKLIDKTRQNDIKYDALRFLAYSYKEKGDLKSAKAAVEQIPEIYFTKLTEMACILEGKNKFDAAEKQKWISFENLIQMMWKIVECYETNDEIEKAVSETEKAIQLITVIKNKCFNNYIEFFNKELVRLKKSKK